MKRETMQGEDREKVETGSVESQFEEILSAFEDEDYGKMAFVAHDFLQNMSSSKGYDREVAFARFFKLFGEGYEIWQRGYKYNLVRELFFCAYNALGSYRREAERAEDRQELVLIDGFRHLSNMLIAYTHCENACMCNDVVALGHFSGLCETEEEEGIRLAKKMKQDKIAQLLLRYLERNHLLHSGVCSFSSACREILEGEKPDKGEYGDKIHAIDQNLRQLESSGSPELPSELRAHKELLERLRRRESDAAESFQIKNAEIIWMMSAYIDDGVADQLYRAYFGLEPVSEKQRAFADSLKGHRLGAPSVARLELDDIFDTSLGRDNVKGLTFRLPKIHVVVFDEIYPIDLEVKISALGLCSLLMKADLNKRFAGNDTIGEHGLTPSKIRALQSMISPHAGNFPTFWLKADGTPYEKDTLREVADRPRFLHPYQFLNEADRIVRELPSDVSDSPPVKNLSDLVSKTHEKLDALTELHVKRPVRQGSKEIRDLRNEVSQCRNEIGAVLARLIETLPKSDAGSELVARIRETSSEISVERDAHYNLRRLADKILNEYLKSAFETIEGDLEKHGKWIYDPHRNWYTYLYCRQINLNQKLAYCPDLIDLPEFRALLVELREARPSLEVAFLLGQQCPDGIGSLNLASIRSHSHDVLYMMENQAVLYFPDEPQFLSDQYTRTVELIFWIRSLVLAFHKRMENQVRRTERLIQKESVKPKEKPEQMMKAVKYIDGEIDKLEIFRAKALGTIHLLESVSMSRYQDHGKLMSEMLKFTNVTSLKAGLEQGLANVLRLQTHLKDKLNLKLAEIEREREKRSERWFKYLTFLLAIMTASFPLDVLRGYFGDIVVAFYAIIIGVALLAMYAYEKLRKEK